MERNQQSSQRDASSPLAELIRQLKPECVLQINNALPFVFNFSLSLSLSPSRSLFLKFSQVIDWRLIWMQMAAINARVEWHHRQAPWLSHCVRKTSGREGNSQLETTLQGVEFPVILSMLVSGIKNMLNNKTLIIFVVTRVVYEAMCWYGRYVALRRNGGEETI